MVSLSHHDLTVTIRHIDAPSGLLDDPEGNPLNWRGDLWHVTAEYLGEMPCLRNWGDLLRTVANTAAFYNANLPELWNE